MIVALTFFLAFAQPDTAVQDSELTAMEIQMQRTAEIAIKSAEDELAKLPVRSILNERLLSQARTAHKEGRYEDAIAIARRVRLSVARRGSTDRTTTKPAVPSIESLYDALERLFAAENKYGEHPLISTARELIANAEAALEAGNISQADQLSKRAVLMLYALPPASERIIIKSDTERLNINTASFQQLISVPNITKERAENLLWFREHIGYFMSLDEIRFVPGFDRAYLNEAYKYFKMVSGMKLRK